MSTPVHPPVHRRATTALVVGVVTLVGFWTCFAGFLGVVAVVQGVRARAEIRASAGALGGDGRAVAGIVTGALAVLLSLVVAYAVLETFATGGAA
ncbi:DUF4190 domain-containing protein [Nocardioides iriomotensis]|jgi:uncharacterized protein DUF4190|nr:DUF4190 domain-containing protein [Nocardioides iriomotensis]